MGKVNFSDEFKRDAVRQITERGYPVSELSQRLGVSAHSLYAWRKKYAVAAMSRSMALTVSAAEVASTGHR